MGTRSPNARRLVASMPPLLEEETKPLTEGSCAAKFSGTSCEKLVMVYFLSQGINVAEPNVDDGVDLLIEKPEGWARGQVKKVVYQFRRDPNIYKRSGEEVYRSHYRFRFQGASARPLQHLKAGRKQRGPDDCDYFYHVLLTPYRQLIWETPVDLIGLREDGKFIDSKDVVLERSNWCRKKAEIDFSKLLVYSRYDPIIFKTYPDFFLKPEPATLNSFFGDVE